MKAEEKLKTMSPEEFQRLSIKSTCGGKIMTTLNEIGLMLAKEDHFHKNGQFFTGSMEFVEKTREFRRLILSEFNSVLENES